MTTHSDARSAHRSAPAWRRTPPDNLWEAFHRQALAAPAQTAVLSGSRRWTFRELAEGSARIARTLQEAAVRPGQLVALRGQASAELVYATLAVLRTGAVCLPLDPSHPPAWRDRLVESARPALIVSVPDTACGPDETFRLERPAHEPRTLRPGTALVNYTSGSTGVPAGVITSHRAVMARIGSFWRRYPCGPGHRGMLKASMTFVDAARELFGGLLAGESLVIAPPSARREPAELLALAARTGVTRLLLPPSVLEVVLDLVDRGADLPAIKHWVVTGDRFTGKLARRSRRTLGEVLITNLYGASEAVGTSWDLPLRAEDIDPRADVPVGRPFDTASAHVLDATMRPVVDGATGVLHLGGTGLADGYLDDIGREHAFTGTGSHRAYRTGDVARRLPDGSLVLEGRADRVVNLNGQRIHPGQIERELMSHPAVSSAAAVARGAGGRTTLVACVTLDGPADAAELRAWLAGRLPAHLVPGLVETLDRMPLTDRGKVDYGALRRLAPPPEPSATEPPAVRDTHDDGGPRAAVAAAWREVLGSWPALDDDFLASGGDSVAAAALAVRVSSAGFPLTAADVLRSPTTAALIRLLSEDPGQSRSRRRQPAPVSDKNLATAGQRAFWLADQLDPEDPDLVIRRAYSLSGAVDATRLGSAVDELVARQPALRTTLAVDDEGDLVCEQQPSAPGVLRTLHLPGHTVESALHRITGLAPALDLETGPTFSAALASLGIGRHVLDLRVHHACCDGRAATALGRLVARLYRGDGHPVPSAARYVAEVDPARAAAYWSRELDNCPPPLFPGPGESATVAGRLLETEAEPIRERARRLGCTPFAVVLAALASTLAAMTGRSDLVIGCAVDTRADTDPGTLLGCHVNVLPVRLRLPDGVPDLAQTVRRALTAVAGAMAFRHFPLQDLVSHPTGGATGQPYDVVLSFDRAPGPPPDFGPAVTAETVTPPGGGTRQPLAVEVLLGPSSAQVRIDSGHRDGTALVEEAAELMSAYLRSDHD